MAGGAEADGWDDYVRAAGGEQAGADITVTLDGRIGVGTTRPRSAVDVPGVEGADSGAVVHSVAVGTSVIEGVRYDHAHESVSGAEAAGNLRVQSVNHVYVHTGGERSDCHPRVFVAKDGRVGMGPDPAHVCTPDTAVETVGGHLTVRPKEGAVCAVTLRAPEEAGAWWNVSSVSKDGRKLVVARGDIRERVAGDKEDWSGAALAITQAADAATAHVEVAGDVSADGALDVGKAASVGGELTVGGALQAAGEALVEGSARVGGSLEVAGPAALRHDATVAGDAAVGKGLSVGKDAHVEGDLTVCGDFTLGDGRTPSTLQVNGDINCTGTITAPQVQELERRVEELQTQVDTLRRKLRLGAPRGLISLWSGTVANVPPGWALCDGKGGTPDLRDRFVLGAGGEYGGSGHARDGTFEHTHGVSVHGHALTVEQLPPHSHATEAPAQPDKAAAPQNGAPARPAASFANGRKGEPRTETAGEGREHAHDVTVPIVNHMPPFFVLAYIMKVAEDY